MRALGRTVLASGAAVLLATGLGGCFLLPQAAPTSPAGTVSALPSASPTASATPTPTPTPTVDVVKATGRMSLYKNLVSKKLTGTCQRPAGVPTLTVADLKNDFFETVEVTVLLVEDEGAVESIEASFGEDSEGITRRIAYQSTPKTKGTSAKLVASGGTDYAINGTATVFEDGSDVGSPIPFSLSIKCASKEW